MVAHNEKLLKIKLSTQYPLIMMKNVEHTVVGRLVIDTQIIQNRKWNEQNTQNKTKLDKVNRKNKDEF